VTGALLTPTVEGTVVVVPSVVLVVDAGVVALVVADAVPGGVAVPPISPADAAPARPSAASATVDRTRRSTSAPR
jgi:hypothetical protein